MLGKGFMRILAEVLLVVVFILMSFNMAFAQELSSSFSGTYEIAVTVDGGTTYNTQIGIEDLGDGKVEVSAEYQGIPINLVGQIKGDGVEGPVYGFEVSVPKLFEGTAELNIIQKDSTFELKGNGSGNYSAGGSSGQGSGTATGRRISADLPASGAPAVISGFSNALDFAKPDQGFPTPSPIKSTAAVGLVLVSNIIMTIISALARKGL